MSALRSEFVQGLRALRPLVASAEVAAMWGKPSALERLSVGALAAHVCRAGLTLGSYLDEAEPSGPPLTPGQYFGVAVADPDLDSPMHVGIRQRSADAAAGGQDEVVAALDACIAALDVRLDEEPAGRLVAVFGGMVIGLDDYIATRAVELVVHSDDLATSVGLPMPTLPVTLLVVATETMLDVARVRHGHIAVMRAMARRERDDVDALRVF